MGNDDAEAENDAAHATRGLKITVIDPAANEPAPPVEFFPALLEAVFDAPSRVRVTRTEYREATGLRYFYGEGGELVGWMSEASWKRVREI